jgi:hypothetical protein
MRKGKHSVFLFLPEEFHASIGLIVAYWSNFEVVFDACLAGLVSAEHASGGNRNSDKWKQKSVKDRRVLFKSICKEWLATRKPEEAAALCKICDMSGDLHRSRNLITHGVFSYSVLPHSSDVTNCKAVNHETGDEMPSDAESLIKLRHDISHLTADLIITFDSIGQVQGPFQLIPDAEILRIYRDTVHPWNPNPKKRPPPQETSEL